MPSQPAPSVAVLELLEARHTIEAMLLDAIIDARSWGGTLAVEGMPLRDLLRTVGRASSAEVARLMGVADRSRVLPRTTAAFRAGLLTVAQLDRLGRRLVAVPAGWLVEELDSAVAALASEVSRLEADPDEVDRRAARLIREAYDRLDAGDDAPNPTSNRLAMQPRLDGGGDITATLDVEGFATVADAIQRSAGSPSRTIRRSAQLAEGLVTLASRGSSGERRVPTVVAHVDLADLTRTTAGHWQHSVPSAPEAFDARVLDTLACHADLVIQLADGHRPLARLRARKTLSTETRQTILARDRGCRFPGCDAPVSWVDVHHIVWRRHGGDHHPNNLLSLCRTHHRSVHRHAWRITVDHDTGHVAWTRCGPDGRKRTLTALPRASARPRGSPGPHDTPNQLILAT